MPHVGAIVAPGILLGGEGGAVPVHHESDISDPPVWSSVRLTARDPYFGRLLVRTFDNPEGADFPYNTVVSVGSNIGNNTNAIDPTRPAVTWTTETSYEPDGDAKSEMYAQVLYDGDGPIRPYYAAYNLVTKANDIQLRGKVQVLKEDVTGALLTINPTTGVRRVTLADDGELAGVAAPVTIRGMKISGSGSIVNNINTPVKLGGVTMSGTEPWHHVSPRRYSQETQPTLPSGASAMWRKPSTNEVRLLYNDPDEGHVTVLLS